MNYLPSIEGLDVKGKRVLVRTDLNVPMIHGKISDQTRILRILPTINYLKKQGAKVIVLSHFGRPEGDFDPSLSLAPITDALSKALGCEVKFGVDSIGHAAEEAVQKLKNGEIILMENLRFHKGEKKNCPDFADQLAKLGDIYVNDAFSCSHRSHASIVGLAERLPSVAGFLLQEEINNLEKVLANPVSPVMAIVGGSKVSTKIELLENLLGKVNVLVVGGRMANTFLAAKGYKVGKSIYEKDFIATANNIMEKAGENGCEIILPVDAMVADSLEAKFCYSLKIDKIPADKMILDISQNTVDLINKKLLECKTVVWNGPLGVFELAPYLSGSGGIARMIAYLTGEGKIKSVAGGGDIVACLEKCGLTQSFTYISTAGGAFLEWLEGKELPGITALLSGKADKWMSEDTKPLSHSAT